VADLSVKILKSASDVLVNQLVDLFNKAINSNTIPTDWKTAIVTPLFKNKGALTDWNSFRGISVLPPLRKVFEKILSKQIKNILNH
jgi:hypothetical protein